MRPGGAAADAKRAGNGRIVRLPLPYAAGRGAEDYDSLETKKMGTVMIKTIAAGCTVLLTALALWACNDKIDVKQAYPFRLTSWHLPEEIAQGENVKIRLTLTKEGDFHDAEYYIGYIQMKGKGEVTDDEGTLLVNRELHALNDMAGIDRSDPMRQVFTLWYCSLSDKNAEVRFIVRDNFGQQTELTVSFDVGRKEPQTE